MFYIALWCSVRYVSLSHIPYSAIPSLKKTYLTRLFRLDLCVLFFFLPVVRHIGNQNHKSRNNQNPKYYSNNKKNHVHHTTFIFSIINLQSPNLPDITKYLCPQVIVCSNSNDLLEFARFETPANPYLSIAPAFLPVEILHLYSLVS